MISELLDVCWPPLGAGVREAVQSIELSFGKPKSLLVVLDVMRANAHHCL